MNSTKLGLRITSSVLATALALAPVHGALAAAPAEDDAAPEDGDDAESDAAPEDTEAEPAEGEDAEGEPAEGDTEATAEGEPAEGEPAEGELPEAEEVEAEEPEAEEPPPPEIDTNVPMRPPEPTWGPKDQYPMTGKGMLITGGLVTGLGAVFIVTSVLITRCDFDSSISCKYGDQRDFLVPTAVAATGLGVLLLGVGVGNHVRYKKWERWEPEKAAVVPTLVPGGGGGLAMVGRF